jgi:hypothetical protein
MKRSVFLALALAIAGTPTSSIAKDLSLRASDPKPKPACRRVTHRFSICASTNFKNKVVLGGAIHFNRVDPSGRLTTMGANRRTYRDPQLSQR